MKNQRDDFSAPVRRTIERRAGHACSICQISTTGANADGSGEITIGTAAHICAASPNGPRYDPIMSSAERSAASNGIWLCRNHGDEVDDDAKRYTVKALRRLKREAEQASWRRVSGRMPITSIGSSSGDGELREAARVDLATIRLTARWPQSAVALSVAIQGLEEPLTSFGLANAARELDDLILVAAPGMGKTTTLLQIAEGVLASEHGVPIYVALADWATGNQTLLGSILERAAWHLEAEADLRAAATRGELVLLLDGWNELAPDARERARTELERLKAEMPELALIISTRPQALDIPFTGTKIDLSLLDEDKQLMIAQALRGEEGAALLDRAWRTPHVRDLVAIPLYLNALMRLPPGSPFPETREAVLRSFVDAHEAKPHHLAKLHALLGPFQRDYLEGLALAASAAATPSLDDAGARRSIAATASALLDDGQIATRPDFTAAVAALVDHHVLVRAGNGLAFQHQQFQEWFASHAVERQIVAAANDESDRKTLQRSMLDRPAWEEAIMFAIERMARGDTRAQDAAAAAILSAFAVDPLLAAEMIYRASDPVWTKIADTIVGWVRLWHRPGTSDRALRFMLDTGRSEFLDFVWPMITDSKDQVSLKALRSCRRFDVRLLGPYGSARVRGLEPGPRQVLLHEIASHGDFDAMVFAVEIARTDPESEVQRSVADALIFRRADRHLNRLLEAAADSVLDHVARPAYPHFVAEPAVSRKLEAARARLEAAERTTRDRLLAILTEPADLQLEQQVSDLVAMFEPGAGDDDGWRLYQLNDEYSRAIADGLLRRLRAGKPLGYGTDDLLAGAGYAVEDEGLVAVALTVGERDSNAAAAASVLGPTAVGRLVDALLPIAARLRDRSLPYDKDNSDRYHVLVDRITKAPVASLVDAARARSANADASLLVLLADLLTRNRDPGPRSRPIVGALRDEVRILAEEWAKRLLADGSASRHDVAEIAELMAIVPHVSLLPVLQQMLNANLAHYGAARAEAQASGWREGRARHEAQNPQTHQYARAFTAINAPETRTLLRGYLDHPHFGREAAEVICRHWIEANEPQRGQIFPANPDYAHVRTRRALRLADPHRTDPDAEAIFAVVERLVGESSSDEQHAHALALACVAARLPHGRRPTTIDRLLALAHRRVAPRLIASLIQSGEVIRTEVVRRGIDAVFEEAKTKTWMLHGSDSYELNDWLRLLPFTDDLSAAVEVLCGIPPEHRSVDRIAPLVSNLAYSASSGVEEALFAIADLEPKILREYSWYTTAAALGSESAGLRLVALTAAEQAKGSKSSVGSWRWSQDLGELIKTFPRVRSDIYARLANAEPTAGARQLAAAVSNALDADGLFLIIELERRWNLRLLSYHDIRNVVTEQVPAPGWSNAFSIVPVAVAGLRRRLLADTIDGSTKDLAARALNAIDEIRDEYGRAVDEPRHPDLFSGRPWPILTPDPDATAI
ncbi:MAG: hypothetical protein PGN16_12615 [Sphingomonas phyllosphaerae]|uniref:NACHT domain-containing protein n=1 Tax=Sphingomonas phyllosphaerae TaxID=257003 RepID=UPI002FF6DC20